ncbi:hypothetical protein llg_00440 [Luteolibacter sp. LG18]|nr:hypothetical protein llg_00440 [Luteolibacter sp. LG18]
MAVLGLFVLGVLVFAAFVLLAMTGRFLVAAVLTTVGRAVGTVGLMQFLGFLPIVALAGNEGHGRKNKKHLENFHRAP